MREGKRLIRLDPGYLYVTDLFVFVFVKAFRSEGVESPTRPSFDEVYDRGGS